ncbi:septum formation associated protein (Maf-like protein) [Gluconobacter morbifer G707]|uniref:Nucleoside triphosphate pyrophosphatase n=2 Tax=Gluconobacter TaxID=441 RepID=G6XK95_9PROT|nr:septum formation associated protein (Maf-like protein) [Gluconobacter morbifer G707]
MLLENSGLSVICRPVDLDEESLRLQCQDQGRSLAETAIALADAKADLASRVAGPGKLIVAADQILDLEGEAFAKPRSFQEARRHLLRLRNRTHTLQSAVVLYRGKEKLWAHVASPVLTMRNFSDGFLDAYLAREGEEILSCVGAYRLEGLGIQLFSEIHGTHDAILGLPVLPLLDVLRKIKVLES